MNTNTHIKQSLHNEKRRAIALQRRIDSEVNSVVKCMRFPPSWVRLIEEEAAKKKPHATFSSLILAQVGKYITHLQEQNEYFHKQKYSPQIK